MRIHIYYGGRGLVEDSTLYILRKIEEVMSELRVETVKYNLHEQMRTMPSLLETLKEADAVILATTQEWFGIGGYMQQFLDACWFYGEKEKIKKLVMMPVVTSSCSGEDECETTLIRAWKLLGGKTCEGICAYVEDYVDFELNSDYCLLIEKKAEMMYRAVNQKVTVFPSSYGQVRKEMTTKNSNNSLTLNETKQLSVLAADDQFVQKQKEDIKELSSFFKGMLKETLSEQQDYIKQFKDHFIPMKGVELNVGFVMEQQTQMLHILVREETLSCQYKEIAPVELELKVSKNCLERIIRGELKVQTAFMAGEMSAKGNFKLLSQMDQSFSFIE